jgi:deoxyhypusine synthase
MPSVSIDPLLQNDIPVFCPALTDGSIGDMIYFHSFRSPGLVLDIVQDIRALNELSRTSKKAGMIILGGGVCKHQIANAMLIVGLAIFFLANLTNTIVSGMAPITLSIS